LAAGEQERRLVTGERRQRLIVVAGGRRLGLRRHQGGDAAQGTGLLGLAPVAAVAAAGVLARWG